MGSGPWVLRGCRCLRPRRQVQTIMRHSTVELTLGTYGHLAPGQEADAVEQLRDMLAVSPAVLKATGTDDLAAEAAKGSAAHMQRAGRDRRQTGASRCDGDTRAAGGEDDRDDERNRLRITALDDDVRSSAKRSNSGRGGIRTHTPLTGYGILSPVRLPVPPLGRRSGWCADCRTTTISCQPPVGNYTSEPL